MISSPSLRIYASTEEGGSNEGGNGKDNEETSSSGGGDKERNNEGGKGSNDAPKEEDKQETNDEPKTSNCGGEACTGTEKEDSTVTPNDLKGTPEEQEKAAVEDYVNEEPGIKKPYPPKEDESWTKKGVNHEGWKNMPECKDHKWSKDCKWDGGDDCKNKGWTHECKRDHGDDNHDHHNNWCSHHDCHHHNHHTSTHFSDNHNGDVTVKVHVTDYKSNDLEDVHLIIGDVYEKNLDLSDEPDTIKVDNLDIDGGDDFAVCLANEDSDEGDCVVTHADNDHDEVNVNLKVL